MNRVRSSGIAFAAAYVVLVVGLLLALEGLAYAHGPSSARDQYGTKVKGVTVTTGAKQPQVAEEDSGLPNTGLSLLGTVVVGGTLVGVGVALRKRERG